MVMTPAERVKKSRLKNDRITLYPPKEKGSEIRAAAKLAGESLTQYIMQAVEMRLQSEKNKTE